MAKEHIKPLTGGTLEGDECEYASEVDPKWLYQHHDNTPRAYGFVDFCKCGGIIHDDKCRKCGRVLETCL